MLYTYAAYLIISLAITYWVGRTLSRNGRLFLVDAFRGREELADSVNHLLLVGFYLVNLGFVTLALEYGVKPTDVVSSVEFLSTKVGMAVVVLGAMHFFNMFALVRFKKSTKSAAQALNSDSEPMQPQDGPKPA
jgi:hypothetical protein